MTASVHVTRGVRMVAASVGKRRSIVNQKSFKDPANTHQLVGFIHFIQYHADYSKQQLTDGKIIKTHSYPLLWLHSVKTNKKRTLLRGQKPQFSKY